MTSPAGAPDANAEAERRPVDVPVQPRVVRLETEVDLRRVGEGDGAMVMVHTRFCSNSVGAIATFTDGMARRAGEDVYVIDVVERGEGWANRDWVNVWLRDMGLPDARMATPQFVWVERGRALDWHLGNYFSEDDRDREDFYVDFVERNRARRSQPVRDVREDMIYVAEEEARALRASLRGVQEDVGDIVIHTPSELEPRHSVWAEVMGGHHSLGTRVDARGLTLRDRHVTNDLDGSDLRGADFSGSTFERVSMSRSDFTGAIFDGAQFIDVFWGATICPDGTRSEEHGMTCAGHLVVQGSKRRSAM